MRHIATNPMIVRQHAEDAAFLFVQRAKEVRGHDLAEIDLGRRDQRLEANIAGLLAAGQTGWDIVAGQATEFPGAGEAFAAGALAIANGEHVAEAISLSMLSPFGAKGLSGALAWSDFALLKPYLSSWHAAADPALRQLALIVMSHHRHDPEQRLQSYFGDADPGIRSRAARLAFEHGRVDAVPQLQALAIDDGTGFWARMALARLGYGAEPLEFHAKNPDDPNAGPALDMRLIARPDEAKACLARLMQRPETEGLALSRAGLLGDRSILPWLIRQMQDPASAECAGFALRDLFPIHADESGLFTASPDRLGDAFSDLDPATLPVAEKVADWAKAGCPVPEPFVSLRRQMLDALRAAIRTPSAPLQNWRARRRFPAWI